MTLQRDLLRVAKGATLVLDHLIAQNQSGVTRRAASARYHANELAKILIEMARERLAQQGSSPFSEAPTSGSGPGSSARAAEEDLIGFSAVKDEELSAKISAQNNGQPAKAMREAHVPSTQLGRMFGFGSLAARMAVGAAFERATGSGNTSSGSGSQQRYQMSDENAERLAETLCRMRGAALKLGQMLSVQDEGMLPPALARALDRVKQAADYMPSKQLEQQLSSELGPNWREKLLEFEPIPIAAASIGQVHRAKLLDGTVVAMKIQYPGVASSIESDLNNLKTLVTMTGLLPAGLFVDEIIRVARTELAVECDYLAEAQAQTRYRALVAADSVLSKHLSVPEVFPELSTRQVLTSRFVHGVTIDKTVGLPQSVRNAIARTVLISTMRELFEWRFIQSDPNFGNYLYDDVSDPVKRTIHSIDFGASREYPKPFVDGYMKIVWAAANQDRATVLAVSKELKFLTGDETPEMVEAHVDAALVVGEAFRSHEKFDFGTARLTQRIGQYGGVFMKYRLTPPPTEAYSLHRKLAGAILLCVKLKAEITCRDILEKTYENYVW